MKPLGSFCEFKYGKSLPKKNRNGGDIPVFGSNGIVGYHDVPLTAGEAIIIGRKGSAGALQYSKVPCCPIDTTYYIDRTCTDVDLRWLFFTLQNLGLDHLNKHVAVPGLNRNDAYEKEVLVPPLDEQKRIAAVLDNGDTLRRQRQESLQLTEKLLQSVFIDMFGDPVTNPKGWDTVPLEKLCEKIVDCPHSTPVYSETTTGFYCVRSSDIQNGKLDLASARQVSESIFKERIARHEPRAGEVVYTREGGRLGFAAQVPQGKRICLGQRMMLFKGRKNVSTNTFLAKLLNSESIRRKVLNLVGGGAAPRVNIKDLRTLVVFQPPFELQERFEAFAASLQAQEESLAQSAKQAARLFGSLQQRAFRGELDLNRLVLDPVDDIPTAPAPTQPVTKPRKPKATAHSLRAPADVEPALRKLDRVVKQGEMIPWSTDYFLYRILGTLPVPFGFSDAMQRAEPIFDRFSQNEPLLYDRVREVLFDLLGQDGKPALLRQRFDLQTDEKTSEITGRKEIVFEPVS